MHPQLTSREEAAGRLRRQGITPTHQRVEIAYALFSRAEHLSADRILSIVNEQAPETSKATVYNTLNLFVEKKLVREVIVDPSRVFYDPNTDAHHHFYNTHTGELTDIPARDIQLSALPAPPAGTVAEGVDIIVRLAPAGAAS